MCAATAKATPTTWYSINRYDDTISMVQVERYTDHFLWIVGIRCPVARKGTCAPAYFQSEQEVIQYLASRLEWQIDRKWRALNQAKSLLAEFTAKLAKLREDHAFLRDPS